MAGAIISIVGERLKAFMDEQTGDRVSLVTGVEKEVRSLASGLNIIRYVLVDAENRRFKEESIKDWLKRLEYTSYEMEDVLDEWNYAILKHKMEHESNDAVPPNNKEEWQSGGHWPSRYNKSPSNLNFDCLTSLRVLGAGWPFKLYSIQDLENLIHLRWLDLSGNDLSGADLKTICKLYNLQTLLLSCCKLQEIPREIGNLIHLRHLDLSGNHHLKELPEDICGLHELRTLNAGFCPSLCGFPKGLAQLTGLRTLTEFHGGSGRSKLGWLKNLNRLVSLKLCVNLADDDLEDVVEDARKAELWNKSNIEKLWIRFKQFMHVKSMDVIDALKPHPNLLCLGICGCIGPKYPGWITSLNQLRHIKLGNCGFGALPPLGKLPCLEEIEIIGMRSTESVGREFLGITTTIGTGDVDIQSSSSSVAAAATNTIVFPKLKKLTFSECSKWKEWEDITAEEEESTALALMPCLTKLSIQVCGGLNTLPHRLLRKASVLEVLDISDSIQLERRYGNKGGPDWKSISQNNPRLQLKLGEIYCALNNVRNFRQ